LKLVYEERNKVSTGDFQMFHSMMECKRTAPYRKYWLYMNKLLQHKAHDPWDKENYYFIVALLNNIHGNTALFRQRCQCVSPQKKTSKLISQVIIYSFLLIHSDILLKRLNLYAHISGLQNLNFHIAVQSMHYQ
jgi:hypothetical protein